MNVVSVICQIEGYQVKAWNTNLQEKQAKILDGN